MTPTPPIVLVLAGNDPSGGAGIAADLLTLSALGCHGLPVITALTVQDSTGVEEVQPIEADLLSDQARFILEDMAVSAIKIGLSGSIENLAVIAEIASDYPDIPLILDPVFASGGGDELATEEMVAATRELVLPYTYLVTPNSHEARRLASEDPEEQELLSLDEAGRRLISFGTRYVLATGTHEPTPMVTNLLLHEKGRLSSDNWERLPGSYHGSGCTMASAVAAYLAQGMSIVDASKAAQRYTHATLRHAFRPGMGQAIPNRLFALKGLQ